MEILGGIARINIGQRIAALKTLGSGE